jgi:hypothetical protein
MVIFHSYVTNYQRVYGCDVLRPGTKDSCGSTAPAPGMERKPKLLENEESDWREDSLDV